MNFVFGSAKEQHKVHTETWKIQNFLTLTARRTIHTVRDVPGPRPLSPLNSWTHIFFIERTSLEERAILAEANLTLDTRSRLVLTISFPKQTPDISVKAEFVYIDLVNNNRPVCNVYNSENSSHVAEIGDCRLGEINPPSSICTKTMNLTTSSVQAYLDRTDMSLTIRFSLRCKIAQLQPTVPPKPPVNASVDINLEFCGFQALNDYEALLKDTATADMEIKVTLRKPKSFHCHKSILTARSPILRAMFDSPMKEARDKVLIVEDLSAETMEHFLSFLYCGRFQDETWITSLPHLTYAADKYCVSSLKQLCDHNLIRSVTCQNALAIANLAQRHKLTKAVEDIRNFIAKNASQLNLDIAAATEGLDLMD